MTFNVESFYEHGSGVFQDLFYFFISGEVDGYDKKSCKVIEINDAKDDP